MLSLMKEYDRTCSAEYPVNNAVAMALNGYYYDLLLSSGMFLAILVPKGKAVGSRFIFSEHNVGNCLILPRKNPVVDFIIYHNEINKNRERRIDKISTLAKIHPQACIDCDGMRYCKDNEGNLLNMKHMGGVIIGDYAEIGPFSIISRATLDYTTVGKHTRIGSGVQIGHNVQIGSNTIIVDGVTIGGSAKVGSNCFIGLKAVIRNGVKICSNVFIGMGAVVVKDIENSGVYMGMPAVKIKEWDGGF